MDERTVAFGVLAPKKKIEFNGTVYEVAPLLTEGTLLRIETRLYEQAKQSLKDSRDLYTDDEYRREVAKLRERREEGAFSFTNEDNLTKLNTVEGACLVLSCMLNAPVADTLALFAAHQEELKELLDDALSNSFPKVQAPQPVKKSRGKVKGKRQ